jgi:hypothetical protein
VHVYRGTGEEMQQLKGQLMTNDGHVYGKMPPRQSAGGGGGGGGVGGEWVDDRILLSNLNRCTVPPVWCHQKNVWQSGVTRRTCGSLVSPEERVAVWCHQKNVCFFTKSTKYI